MKIKKAHLKKRDEEFVPELFQSLMKDKKLSKIIKTNDWKRKVVISPTYNGNGNLGTLSSQVMYSTWGIYQTSYPLGNPTYDLCANDHCLNASLHP